MNHPMLLLSFEKNACLYILKLKGLDNTARVFIVIYFCFTEMFCKNSR